MRTLFLASLALAVVSPVACGGLVDPGGAAPAPSSTTHPGPITAPTYTAPPAPSPTPTPSVGSSVPPVNPAPPPAECSMPGTVSTVSFASQSDALAHVARVWRACPGGSQSPSAIGGPAGFEIGADGSYHALGFDPSGNLLRLTGFMNEGAFEYQENGGTIAFASTSFYPFVAALSADATTLELDSTGGPSGPFVASEESVVVAPTAPPGDREGAAGCGVTETSIIPHDVDVQALGAALVGAGTWLDCPGESYGEGAFPASNVGLQFNSDGTWAFLVYEGGGSPVPSTDPAAHGSYDLEVGQLNLDLASGDGTYIFSYALSTEPMKLWLDNEGGVSVLSAE